MCYGGYPRCCGDSHSLTRFFKYSNSKCYTLNCAHEYLRAFLPDGEAAHLTPVPNRHIFCFAAGAAVITASDGTSRKFDAGSVLLMEDTWGKGHSTQLIGEADALLFAVTLADSEPPSRGEPDALKT